jgi:hypothetical protein
MELVEQSGGAKVSGYADSAVALGRVALAEEKYEAAAAWAGRALASPAKRTGAMASAAQLVAAVRRAQGQPQDAVELLVMADRAGISSDALRQRMATELRELESELTPEAYAAAVARGEGRELAAWVAEMSS